MTKETSAVICAEAADDLRELQRLRGEIEAIAGRLDDIAFLRPPAEGQWSVGDCIAHLNATARTYLDKLPGAIAVARADGLTGEGPIKRSLFGRFFLWALEPPSRVKAKAPQAFLPRPGLDQITIMSEFRQIRDELGSLMHSSGDLDWSRVSMPLPTLPRVKLRLGEIFAVLLAHERRHLWQMQKVVGDRS